jgi:hypothetical protein
LTHALQKRHQGRPFRVSYDLLGRPNQRSAAHANPSLRASIARLLDRSDLYRRVGLKIDPHRWAASDEDHIALLAAFRRGESDRAVEILARHSARTALTVMAQQLPEREPATIRSALQLALGIRERESKLLVRRRWKWQDQPLRDLDM